MNINNGILLDCRDGSVRLVDGDNYNATTGRVEYCVGGRWGTVCNYEWGEADATVVCRQLGLNIFSMERGRESSTYIELWRRW